MVRKNSQIMKSLQSMVGVGFYSMCTEQKGVKISLLHGEFSVMNDSVRNLDCIKILAVNQTSNINYL